MSCSARHICSRWEVSIRVPWSGKNPLSDPKARWKYLVSIAAVFAVSVSLSVCVSVCVYQSRSHKNLRTNNRSGKHLRMVQGQRNRTHVQPSSSGIGDSEFPSRRYGLKFVIRQSSVIQRTRYAWENGQWHRINQYEQHSWSDDHCLVRGDVDK